MAHISLDLISLAKTVFGVKPVKFEFDKLPTRKEYSQYGAPLYELSVTGKEYYLPVTLGGYSLPFPILSISGSKSIVKTELQGRRGTVKELINIDDYRITIRGFIVSPDNEYPEQVITDLRKLFERNESLPIESAITDIFLVTPDRGGFDEVVIESLEFPEMPGVKNVRPYVMQLVSDEPFDLYID